MAGRKRKHGERFPGGKLKSKPSSLQPVVDPITGAQWQRILQQVKRGSLDPRCGSQLTLLHCEGKLTVAQTAAGLKVGEIYGAFERYKGRRRSAPSASYEIGFGPAGAAEEALSGGALEALEETIRAATRKWEEVQKLIPSPRIRGIIEDLCVDDKHINPMAVPHVRAVLDFLAVRWGLTGSGHRQEPRSPATRNAIPLHFNNHEDARADLPDKIKPKYANHDRTAAIVVMRKLRPDLGDDELGEWYDQQQAYKQRAIFNAAKAKKTPKYG